MKKNSGFSLIELLIVVAIILIIAAIAVPNLLRARIAANEASASATLRTINTGEITYASTYNSGFSNDLHQLGAPASGLPTASAADLVDPVLAGNAAGGSTSGFTKNGFTFIYSHAGTYPAIPGYSMNANPTQRGTSGQRSFYSDQTAVIRANSTALAASTDNPI